MATWELLRASAITTAATSSCSTSLHGSRKTCGAAGDPLNGLMPSRFPDIRSPLLQPATARATRKNLPRRVHDDLSSRLSESESQGGEAAKATAQDVSVGTPRDRRVLSDARTSSTASADAQTAATSRLARG